VTAKDINSKIISYTVDDGSESIECIIFKNDLNENEIADKIQFELFDTLSVKGKINDFRNQRKLHITNIRKEYDVNVEVFFWLEVMKQRKEYQKEYVITEESKKDVNKFYEKKKLNAINKKVYIFDDYYEIFKKLDDSKRRKISNKQKTVDETILKYKIREYLNKKKLYAFQFSKIKEEFKDLAEEILKQKENNVVSEERISFLFSRIFHQLVEEGIIFKYDSVSDTYALIHYKYNLGQAIYEIINSNKNCKYISYQDITKLLSKSKAFKFAPEKVIKKSLNYLVENEKLVINETKDGTIFYSLVKNQKSIIDEKEKSNDSDQNKTSSE